MFEKIVSALKDFVIIISSNAISLLGAIVATTSTFLFFIFVGVSSFNLNNYIGILGFLIIPGFFIFGLVLIPVGFFIYRRKIGFRDFRDVTPSRLMEKFRITRPQGLATTILLITGLNVLILVTAGYESFHYMESNIFCGTLCHKVMTPEYTAYQDSSHSRVPCVDCHIGAGADWFVKSKLSGLRQVFAVAFNTYHRPIETPIRNLRPARETCEQCHWPEKFAGQKLKNIIRHDEDEKSTPSQTVLLLHVGSAAPGEESGIHKHVAKNFKVKYISENDLRENILWVELQSRNGTSKTWSKPGYSPTAAELAKARVMDCIDCHNRATHTYETLNDALDKSISLGRIDRDLPYMMHEASTLLKGNYKTQDEGEKTIRKNLDGFYRANYSAIYDSKKDSISKSADEIVRIYRRNIHPEMKVTWGTYPNHIGHTFSTGCFRCHNSDLVAADNSSIPQDCDKCHSLLRMSEPNPKPLEEIFSKNP